MHRHDVVGRPLGIIVFLCGVGLLVYVFSLAHTFFATCAINVGSAKATSGPVAAQLGSSAVSLLARIGLLIVMTIVGSLIAGRGIQLYFASTNHPKPSIEPVEPKAE